MAHWIIEDKGFGGTVYQCSACKNIWNDLFHKDISSITEHCPGCGILLNEDEIEYIDHKRERKEFKPYKTMTFADLCTHIRNENTRILLMDGLEFVCMALMKSPVFKPYLGRPIAFIELPSGMNKDIVCGAELIITLEVE